MAEEKNMRLSLAAKKLNIGLHTIVEKLATKGHKVEDNPNARLNFNQLQILANEYKAPQLLEDSAPKPVVEAFVLPEKNKNQAEDAGILYFRDSPKTEASKPEPQPQPISTPKATEPELIKAKAEVNLKIVGKIDLATGKPIEEPKPEPAKVETPRVDAPKVETPRVEIPKVETLQVETPKVEPAKEVTASLASPRVDAPPIVETPKVEMPKATPVVEAPKVQQQPVANKPVQQVGDRPQQQPNRPQQSNQQPQRTDNRNNDRNRNDQNRNQQGGGTQNRNQQGGQGGGQNRNQNPQGGGQNQPKKPREEYKIPPQRSLNDRINTQPVTTPPPVIEAEVNVELIEAKGATLKGLTVLGKIQLPTEQSRNDRERDRRKKRKRIPKTGERVTEKEMSKEPGVPRPPKDGQARPAGTGQGTQGGGNNQHRRPSGTGGTGTTTGTGTNTGTGNNTGTNNRRRGGTPTTGANREEVSQKDVQDQIKATMARMSGNTNKPAFGAKERRQKRKHRAERAEQQFQQEQEEAKVLKVTEFISASDLASLMDVSVNEVISTCMSMGMFVSINQRLDAEAITIIADEFNFEVTFVSAEEEIEAALAQEIDRPEDLIPRAPIVTVMGHVDHGKTSLLDYIRRTKVAAGEAGGITQHIGAYRVTTDSGHDITFLDTPGHEAFTAMRARGAKVTDVAIIVIAADDSVMPQTREAINHAQVAGVPIVFAFTKVDKAGANTDKIRTELSAMNLNVVEWGGKYESQEISSKSGAGIADLLEKVVLETEILDFKANPNKKAVGTIIEASLDKGRGYVATVLIQSGTLKQGDMMLAGSYYGRVKAMLDYNGNKLKTAGPSTPVQILGLNGAPSAGDKLNSMENERDAREIAGKREQILREQSMRTRKHITLDEIGRRKAIGVFKELNVIVKGDVDGSVEALSDALLKLSTEEVQVRIIHKAVGQVSESDVLLASASDAIIVAFQVRPSVNAKRLADQEQIEIRNYSIIYQAIDEIRDAMEGLLEPKMEEHVTSNIEVRDVFKITKVGTVAGCYVLDGTVKRAHKIRVIRDFIVVHEGDISALKRFKEDVAEVKFGYECGLSIKNFNDIEVGDMLECYEMKEVKRTL